MDVSAASVLVLSHKADNRAHLRRIFESAPTRWNIREARSLLRLDEIIRPGSSGVVISEYRLPDANWKSAFAAVQRISPAWEMVVVSPLADEHMWAEVLNLGGFDLIVQPPDPDEILRVCASAWRQAAWRAGHLAAAVLR